jgi:hypothetical protein
LRTLRTLDHLKSLFIHQELPWRTLAFLAYTPHLESLSLNNLNELDSFAPIGDLSALRSLHLWGYTDRALACLGPVDKITSLSLFDPKDKGDLLVVPDTFPCVTDVNLGAFNSLDLAPLATLPLDNLILQNSSCADLQPLTRIPSLRSLLLLGMKTNPDLSPLAGLELQLTLVRGQSYVGLDKLGPDVKITYL